MIVSVNWLKKFTEITLPIDELAALIGSRLVEIEEVIDLGAKYHSATVAKVVACEPVEGADRLNRCMLDDGGVVSHVERNEQGYIQVVCGAPNVAAGKTVVWLPPNTTVPSTVGTDDPFVLGSRALRGVMSHGMLASPKELALSDQHDGILLVDDTIAPGTLFADAYELNDYLLDIENKSLTHRPDCFGIIGFAREVAAIQGKTFTTPDWLLEQSTQDNIEGDEKKNFTIAIEDSVLSDRYTMQMLTVNGTNESPLWMQTYLSRTGIRPVSAVVDITNYLMLLTGQPMHAFDYDKVKSIAPDAAMSVRSARNDETLTLLNQKTITLSPKDIVIAAGDTAVGLAGAMGGASTEIDASTTRILLESATFNLYSLRSTQMRHGIFSEAVTRFTKGQPAGAALPVLKYASGLLKEHAGAQTLSAVDDAYPGNTPQITLEVPVKKINDILGTTKTADECSELLRRIEFDVHKEDGDILKVTVPYWRTDIHIDEDVAEEIGRISGFDEITPAMPTRSFTPVRLSAHDAVRAQLRAYLQMAGANEVLTYSFVHGDILRRATQQPQNSYRLVNSISPELQYYRQTLTPSLLNLVNTNIRQGYDAFALFELNKVHPKTHGLTDEELPGEIDMLSLVYANKHTAESAPYYQAKRILDFLGTKLGLTFHYSVIEDDPGYPVTAPFEPKRSALITEVNSGAFIGIIGEYKESVAKSFKLPSAAGFEVGTMALLEAYEKRGQHYTPVSRFPGVERDLSVKVPRTIHFADVEQCAATAATSVELTMSLLPRAIYRADGANDKTITLRIAMNAHDRTLTGNEANKATETIANRLVEQLGAVIV